jgi:hypothetical protein
MDRSDQLRINVKQNTPDGANTPKLSLQSSSTIDTYIPNVPSIVGSKNLQIAIPSSMVAKGIA